MTHPLSVDRKSWDLAEHFLPPNIAKEITDALAQVIQDAIEDFIQYSEHAREIAKLEAQ